MKIIAIREIFKLQSSFYLPNHSDFVMMKWSEIDDSLNNDAYIQTNIQGARKAFDLNPMYSWVRNSKKPYLVMEQPVFRKGRRKFSGKMFLQKNTYCTHCRFQYFGSF